MHTYRKSKDEKLWTVGYYEPRCDDMGQFHKWVPLEDFDKEVDARRLVNFLNGGNISERE